jgi:hypothetical protein
MGDPVVCQSCLEPIPDRESAHQAHELACERFLCGVCRCDEWVCVRCCPEPECTSLAVACAVAREDTLARAAAADAACEVAG